MAISNYYSLLGPHYATLNKDELLLMLKDARFVTPSYMNMTFGVVAIHTAFKL
jgi:hypothetical protein